MRRSLAHTGAPTRGPYEQWERLHRSPPGTLFHDTTTQGLLSMLRTGHVWATESRAVNDPRELVQGAGMVLQAIDRRLARRKSGFTAAQVALRSSSVPFVG